MLDHYELLVFGAGLIAALVAYIYVKDMNRLNAAIAQLSETLGSFQRLLMESGFVSITRCDHKCGELVKRVDAVERDLIAGGSSWPNNRGD